MRVCRCWWDPGSAQLEDVEPLRDGTLARCCACGELGWHRAGDRAATWSWAWRTPVGPLELPVVREWGAGRFPVGEHAESLAAIGAVDGVTPCRIRWADGSVSDPAVVVVSAWGPLRDHEDLWRRGTNRMFRGVAAVEPSSFALPLEIRVESGRDRHTVFVIAPDGRSDALSSGWTMHVATLGPHRGAALRKGEASWWQALRYCLSGGVNPFPPGFTVVWADLPQVMTASP